MKRVLVVDDNEDIRFVVTKTLEKNGYEVTTACNGDEAIEIMTQQPAQIVLLDIRMPVTDGWETLRIIKDEYNGWPETEIIMMTVCNEPENPLKAWSIGASYYLPKPFSLANMLELVQRASEEKVSTQ